MSDPERDRGGIVFGVGFVLLGIWALAQTAQMSPLGTVFPRTVATAMVVFAIACIVQASLRRRRPLATPAAASNLRRVLLVAVMLGWAALLPVFGFIGSSLVATVLLGAVANHEQWTPRRLVVYPATGIAIVGIFYVLFAYVLKVPLPEATLFGS